MYCIGWAIRLGQSQTLFRTMSKHRRTPPERFFPPLRYGNACLHRVTVNSKADTRAETEDYTAQVLTSLMNVDGLEPTKYVSFDSYCRPLRRSRWGIIEDSYAKERSKSGQPIQKLKNWSLEAPTAGAKCS